MIDGHNREIHTQLMSWHIDPKVGREKIGA